LLLTVPWYVDPQYVLGYGGGLVGGDSIEIDCSVGADTTGTMQWMRIANADVVIALATKREHGYALCAYLCVFSLVVLGTQATTKVFKADGVDAYVRQSFTLTLAQSATLAFLPDPITCFEAAKYRQKQVFHLDPSANLVFVDWLTSGRKRNYISTGSVRDNRTEVNEHWDFSEYDNIAEIFVGGNRLLIDRVRLASMWRVYESACRLFALECPSN
jgi:urease accessory protein